MQKNITVFGPGLMGSGISQLFASKGFKVTICARDSIEESYALESIKSNIKILIENGAEQPDLLEKTLGNITITRDRKQAVRDAYIVFECIPENMELKQDLFYELDCISSEETILATNTSVMSVTEIGARAKHKSRIIGTHFWNPPFLIPLVEVVKTAHVSDAVVQNTVDLLVQAGKHPVICKKDVPGFVANRLQHALWREAIAIIEQGIADPETVDEAIKYSFGIRLPVLGPIENADMIGLDLTLSIHDYIFKYLDSSTEPSMLLKDKVKKGELGFKTGKGFREWTAEEMQSSRKRLLEYLIKATKGLSN
ncbi:3-hydroxyacyl-CoA dehydrogenase family protein [Moorella sulfitireducens]|uniref:3-hydroxyacyl-CoA dehydrogenase family protein n=1 Tax=Neomoorella sulfitireducens TaxID=2972948 RepID=UPI0021AC3866|nr:3-hydroxyacyl-CoA dehydrogenase NAD-binding domain-containing protein [Moorella sulfitireducens]